MMQQSGYLTRKPSRPLSNYSVASLQLCFYRCVCYIYYDLWSEQ